jgi:AcrR family transcriptional regulator
VYDQNTKRVKRLPRPEPAMPAALQIDVRDAVLTAAEQLLGRLGYRKMTVDDIARAAGVGKGTVYLHFRSKEEVALATIDRLVGRVVARLEELARGPGTSTERLRAMLAARVLVRFDAVAGYSASLDELLADVRPALLERRKGWFRREERVFAALLADGARDGLLAPVPSAATARALLHATNAFLPLSLTTRQLGRRAEVAAQVRQVADLLITGLAPRWTAPPPGESR